MKSWIEILDSVKKQKELRNWNRIFWAIDLHNSVITGKYNKFNNGAELYPFAKQTLDYLYDSALHRTILWTSSYNDAANKAIQDFNLKFHYFNENPECPSTDLCDFSNKFYFNILIDDKSGFSAESDWAVIYHYLKIHQF